MPIIIWILGAGAAAWGGSKILQNTAHAANETSNAAIKIAVAAGIGFVVLKKMKVI
jgi:hypothetical protein